MDSPIDSVKRQYERFPYPPVSFLALPQKKQGQNLKFEFTHQWRQGTNRTAQVSHQGIRILVAGAGTLEALVVAQMHPQAREIVAVDLSQASLDSLQKRIYLSKMARFTHKLPPIRLICTDLRNSLADEGFEYIVASNVLHHVPDPAQLLAVLATQLKPNGWIRIVTYPKASRIWMRQTGEFLRNAGLSPESFNLVNRARKAITALPADSPIRACFESQPETGHPSGIIDAYFNACENPLSPLEWKAAADRAGLRWVAEAQTESSRSTFLDEIIPELSHLPPWIKLQILDDFLEVCANPILWFQKISEVNKSGFELPTPLPPDGILRELRKNLVRSQRLLEGTGVTIKDIYEALKTQVGPRVNSPQSGCILKGMAIVDYSWDELNPGLCPGL